VAGSGRECWWLIIDNDDGQGKEKVNGWLLVHRDWGLAENRQWESSWVEKLRGRAAQQVCDGGLVLTNGSSQQEEDGQ